MSEFGFSLSKIHTPNHRAQTCLQRLDPRARVLFFSNMVIAFTFAKNLWALLVGLIFFLLLYWLNETKLKTVTKLILRSLPFLVFLAIFQLFRFTATPENPLLLTLFSWQLTIKGFLAAAFLLMRFIVLILVINLAGVSLSSSEIVTALQHLLRPLNRLHIRSDDLVMVIQITLRFVPILSQTIEQITRAQAARGASWGTREKKVLDRMKQGIPIIAPLFQISLKKAENLALAMDSRAYGIFPQRGSYYQLQFKARDGFFIFFSFLSGILFLLL